MTPRHLLLLLAALAALLVAGCGNKEEVVTEGETEGIYIDVGPLDYQVQISRILNPDDVEDRGYLAGIEEVLPLSSEETYFGIFLRVDNQTDEPHRTADSFAIVDTQEKRYEPLDIDPEQNPFAYQPRELQPGQLVPAVGSVASETATQGELLLFRLPYETLQNRPLEFTIHSSATPGVEGAVNLDV